MSENDFLGLGAGNTGAVNTGQDAGGLVFDLTDVKEDVGYEVLAKGNYAAVVDELEFGDSKNDNPMFTVKFKITEGEHEGRVVFDYWVLGGKGAEFGLGKLKKFLSRICPEVPLASFNAQAFADEAVAIGREVTLTLGIQKQTKGEYKGESRNTVKDFTVPTAGAFL